MKIALVHDFLTQLGGAERVLDAFLELFPKAPVFTLVYDKEKTQGKYEKYNIQPSFLQKMPFGVRKYKWYLTLMPKAIESFDLSGYDLVLSDSSAFAKGVQTPASPAGGQKPTTHICYLHTPIRYLWSDRESYLKTAPIPFFIRPLMPLVIKYLQKWDWQVAQKPHYYICNSQNVADRLKKYYCRQADSIIWPPVDCRNFTPSKRIGNYFLVVSRMEPYKKTELVISAFQRLKLPLKIIGTGSRAEELQKTVPRNVEFIGQISDDELAEFYSRAKALIFPQIEDAGITILESMASGRPVIAYRAGGALEIIQEGINGEFFDSQKVESIIKAVKDFDPQKYDLQKIREQTLQFDKEIFKHKIEKFINNVY